ncbi:DUF58 domain-containing protein [Anaerosporobacter faecicola]|uniref:DUF58 domain-containing protein n=1 Tax=Anaerosporobacter faecicola TaxID=2718714 RepID=UPI0014397E00|nr:DUF58 domain-containing protein [Anaerosporobacter faecicola]
MKIYRYILILCIVLSTYLVSNFGGNVTYALFYLSLLLPLLALAYTLYVYQRFRIYQEIERKTIVKGDLVPYRFTVSNEDIITYRSIQVQFFDDMSKVVGANGVEEYTLLPGEKVERLTNLRCNYRGEYEVGVNYVVITDFLRLLKITYPLRSKYKVTVLPRVLSLSKLRILPSEQDSKRTMHYRHPKETEMDTELRNYIYGDNLKRIHWKASAKQHTLQTRKMTQNPRQEMQLFLDLYRTSYTDKDQIIVEDKMIEAELAITKYCYNNGIPIQVTYEQKGRRIHRILCNNDFETLYQESATLKFDQQIPLKNVLEESKPIEGICIILIQQIDEELCYQLQILLQRGAEIVLLYFTTELKEESKIQLETLRSIGICVREILREDELSEIL